MLKHDYDGNERVLLKCSCLQDKCELNRRRFGASQPHTTSLPGTCQHTVQPQSQIPLPWRQDHLPRPQPARMACVGRANGGAPVNSGNFPRARVEVAAERYSSIVRAVAILDTVSPGHQPLYFPPRNETSSKHWTCIVSFGNAMEASEKRKVGPVSSYPYLHRRTRVHLHPEAPGIYMQGSRWPIAMRDSEASFCGIVVANGCRSVILVFQI